MSMFDNINFSEYSLLEGQQADEYRKRKAKEKEEAEKEYTKKAIKRSHTDNPHPYEYSDPNYKSQYQKAKEKEFEDSHNSKGIVGKIKTAKERKEFNKDLEKKFEDRQSESIKRRGEAHRRLQTNMNKTNKDYYGKNRDDGDYAIDAAMRHQRRHTKHESVINMINNYECNYNY